MNAFLMAASFLSLMWALLHIFAGGVSIARPLLNAEGLHPIPKYTQYYCWHMVSFVLLSMAATYFVAALGSEKVQLVAVVATAHALFFALLGLILPPLKIIKYKHMPQGWLFVPVVILGVLGLTWG